MTHVTKAHLLQSESDLTNPSKHFTVVFRRFAAPRICVALVLLLLVSLPASSSLLSLLPPPEASQRLEVGMVSVTTITVGVLRKHKGLQCRNVLTDRPESKLKMKREKVSQPNLQIRPLSHFNCLTSKQ